MDECFVVFLDIIWCGIQQQTPNQSKVFFRYGLEFVEMPFDVNVRSRCTKGLLAPAPANPYLPISSPRFEITLKDIVLPKFSCLPT